MNTRTISPHPHDVVVDSPEAYKQMVVSEHQQMNTLEDFLASRPDFTVKQRQLLALEASLFRVDPDEDPELFIATHVEFLELEELDIQEALPKMKADLIARVTDYLSQGGRGAPADLATILEQRLEATKKIGIYDNLANDRDTNGFFNLAERQPYITLAEIVKAAAESEDYANYRERLEQVTIAHELMHGILTSGTQQIDYAPHRPIRNGLAVYHHTDPSDLMEDTVIRHGEWINEAMLESFRRTLYKTMDVKYEPGVIILEVLDDLSPGLRDELILNAITSRGPGPTFGKVEQLVGPLGIEEIGNLIAKVETFSQDFDQYREDVIRLLPADIQEKARSLFNTKEEEILGNRQWYKDIMMKKGRLE